MERLERLRHIGVRVHAGAFGFSSPQHVFQPLRLMQADAFFLLENEDDQAFKRHLAGGVNVHRELDGLGVPWESVVVDLWSPAEVGAALRGIISRHSLGDLFVNASVGPNTVAIGATLASLFAPVRLFHPGGDQPAEPLSSVEDVRWLPSFRVKGWTSNHVVVLDVLEELGGEASGSEIKRRLRAEHPDVIGRGQGKGNWAQKEHARFQGLMEFLAESGAVEYEATRRRWTVTLTRSGREMRVLLKNDG